MSWHDIKDMPDVSDENFARVHKTFSFGGIFLEEVDELEKKLCLEWLEKYFNGHHHGVHYWGA